MVYTVCRKAGITQRKRVRRYTADTVVLRFEKGDFLLYHYLRFALFFW